MYVQNVIMQTFFYENLIFCWYLKVNDEYLDPDLDYNSYPNTDQNPDALVLGMDPQILILIDTKMSWIPNTYVQIFKIVTKNIFALKMLNLKL
jgi:hypothetical protein